VGGPPLRRKNAKQGVNLRTKTRELGSTKMEHQEGKKADIMRGRKTLEAKKADHELPVPPSGKKILCRKKWSKKEPY